MSWMYTCFSMGARMVLPLRPRVEYDVAMLAMLLAIGVAGPSAGAVRVPSSERAWGGVRERGPERVADYDLSAVLDPFKHTLVGKERLVWRNRSSEPVSSLYVHLYLNPFEAPGSTFAQERLRHGGFRTDVTTKKGEWGYIELEQVTQAGKPVPWVFVHPDSGPETDRTVARFDLPRPVPPGETTVLEIAFHDQLPRVVARTGSFGAYHLVGQWFPKVGVLELPGERGATEPRWNCHEFHLYSEFYADFGDYDVKMTVPKSFQVASAGEEVGEPVEKDGLVTHHFVQGDVHDFAWMAADDFAPPL